MTQRMPGGHAKVSPNIYFEGYFQPACLIRYNDLS
jgi:hypothetical protein